MHDIVGIGSAPQFINSEVLLRENAAMFELGPVIIRLSNIDRISKFPMKLSFMMDAD